jgi:predicted ester cyclase
VVESPAAGRLVGRVAVERTFRTVLSAFPDLALCHSEEFLVFGNRAEWTTTATGTDNGGFMGLPPTGKPFSTPFVFLFTFGNGGEILQERRPYDFSRLLLHLAGEAEPPTEGQRLPFMDSDRRRVWHSSLS